MVAISVLDLVPVNEGESAGDALRKSVDLARHAESLGYTRYWVAEHHNMTGIASAATSVVIGQLAAATSTMRIGAGGVMLPNHAPLIIAEQFGTLESLFPGRIDLGLGRAPGTDQLTMRAMRRDPHAAHDFPRDVMEVQAYFEPAEPGQSIQAVPGAGLNVPLWILGSSLFGAQLAAELGLPYAFASHFAPEALMQALGVYRERFRPSRQAKTPYAMPGISVIAADTDAEARRLFTSQQLRFLDMIRARAASSSRRSTTSRNTGLRMKKCRPRRCCATPSSVRPRRSRGNCRPSSRRHARTRSWRPRRSSTMRRASAPSPSSPRWRRG